MAVGGDGFVGRVEVVEPRRGNRRWPLDLKARIVAESFQPGVRVVDVARRHGVVAHQLSDWRRQAREGLLRLPSDMLPALSVQKEGLGEPAFVPVAVMPEPEVTVVTVVTQASAPSAPEAEVSVGIMTVELVCGVVSEEDQKMVWETIFPTQVAAHDGTAGAASNCGGMTGGCCFGIVLLVFPVRISYESACLCPITCHAWSASLNPKASPVPVAAAT